MKMLSKGWLLLGAIAVAAVAAAAMLDSGHFAVEDSLDEIVGHIKRFYAAKVDGRVDSKVEPVGSTR